MNILFILIALLSLNTANAGSCGYDQQPQAQPQVQQPQAQLPPQAQPRVQRTQVRAQQAQVIPISTQSQEVKILESEGAILATEMWAQDRLIEQQIAENAQAVAEAKAAAEKARAKAAEAQRDAALKKAAAEKARADDAEEILLMEEEE